MEAHCCGKYETPRLPRRVIAVGSVQPWVKLCETDGGRGDYIALSYCWGTTPTMTTTSKTLQRRKSVILLADLPKTISDAVMVARGLGIRYLWVDALCILQDSAVDWTTESAKMADVYSQAYVVIAAEAGPDCNSGLFYQRSHSGRLAKCAVSRSQYKTSLSTRGWAFQEHYLAARKLVFGTDEMGWECGSLMCCECKTGTSMASFHPTFWSDWKMIVEGYTTRALSNPQDRLAALSGVAARYQAAQSNRDEYIGGMWRHNLLDLLLWYVPKPGDFQYQSARHRAYLAPSWSWASVNGPVVYYHRGFGASPEAKLLKCQVRYELASANPYGPVKDARLTLTMRICRVAFAFETGGDRPLTSMVLFSDSPVTGTVRISNLPSDSYRNVYPFDAKKSNHVGFRIRNDAIFDNGSSIPGDDFVWLLPYGFMPDVIGEQPEVLAGGIHYLGCLMKTETLLVGLVFRKFSDDSEMLQRIGFLVVNAFIVGDTHIGFRNPIFESFSDFADNLLRRHTYVIV
jgi:hypothetical protein